jgi:glucose-1-phosphate adenylyltransferase
VILPNVRIGTDCRIRGAVIDEDCEIPDGTVIGYDAAEDAKRFHITRRGVVLVTPDMFREDA